MANTLLTPTVIAKEALMQLENSLVMGNNVHRQYKKEFAKVGDTVTIRKPVKFRSKSGATLDEVNVLERSTSLQLTGREHVAWDFSSQELTLTIEEYAERYIRPAAIALANKIDKDGLALYKDVWNLVGTPGTNPDSFAEVSPAAQRLDEEAVPMEDRKLIVSPQAAWGIAAGITGAYNPQMVEGALRRGSVGHFAGFDVLMDQNVQTHTNGDATEPAAVNNANVAEGDTTLPIDAIAAGTTITEGSVFTIAGCYAVNPVSGDAYPWLREFVVTADATVASNATTLHFAPALYSASATEDYLPYQTVDALPADNAVVTFKGSASTGYPQHLAFHKNAFALVTVPLVVPDSVAFGHRMSKNGLSIRVIKDYDVSNDKEIIRLDVLYGWKAIYPDLACRLTG